ncbi:hypothetical protein GCM10009557_95760 [Virgisporangium ochraceum]
MRSHTRTVWSTGLAVSSTGRPSTTVTATPLTCPSCPFSGGPTGVPSARFHTRTPSGG